MTYTYNVHIIKLWRLSGILKKAAANIKKHGIEFSHASTVLDDPMAITIEDKRHTEQCFVTISVDLLGRYWLLFTLMPAKNK
ncbi:MAG: BrnT family toxin [Nitrospirota bacterium]